MLVRFRTANHRSLCGEAELSLVTQPRKGESRPAGPVLETVRVAGVYGANASGKSNVLDALEFTVSAVRESYGHWAATAGVPRQPFLLDPAMATRPSLYELDIVVAGVRHMYGFEVDDQRVVAEWLYSYPTGARKRTLFERAGDEFTFGRALAGPNNTIMKLTRPNALFLAAAAANSHPSLTAVYGVVVGINGAARLGQGSPDLDLMAAAALHTALLRPRLDAWLKVADLGIAGIRFEPSGDGVPVGRGDQVRDYLTAGKIKLAHHGTDGRPVELPYEAESAGTRIWLSVAALVIPTLADGSVLLVDEVDSSMHPRLSAALIQMFKDPAINPAGAQLVFTSHDVSLLGSLIDDGILDRDEVWFTEKDRFGATKLFPLTDFQPRREENFERAYLQGRYGAMPYVDVGDLRGLFADRNAS